MPDLSGRELLREWEKVMHSVVNAAGSVTARSEIPRQMLQPMQRQLELVQDLIDRERRLQKELTSRLVAPVDAIFDMLEQSGAAMSRQAEALEAAGRALEETAALMRGQAELFERTVAAMRQPTELAKAAAGLERRPRKRTDAQR
jgi:hypothetical protein